MVKERNGHNHGRFPRFRIPQRNLCTGQVLATTSIGQWKVHPPEVDDFVIRRVPLKANQEGVSMATKIMLLGTAGVPMPVGGRAVISPAQVSLADLGAHHRDATNSPRHTRRHLHSAVT